MITCLHLCSPFFSHASQQILHGFNDAFKGIAQAEQDQKNAAAAGQAGGDPSCVVTEVSTEPLATEAVPPAATEAVAAPVEVAPVVEDAPKPV